MIFNTWTFALFAVVAWLVYAALPTRARSWYLVVVGALFYAWSVPAYLALVAVLALVTYGGSALLLRTGTPRVPRRLVATVTIALVAAALAVFKYAGFFAATVDAVTAHALLPVPRLLVPLAISFFTFEFVHVVADAYTGRLERLDPREFAVFAMFFPTLVAGPIKRYESFVPQLVAPGPPPPEVATLHLYRIAIGLVKKIAIADSMSVLAEPLVTPGAPNGPLDYGVAILAYAAKIYFDFSGYSDIAIGVAGLFGFAIPENFDRPYRARDISVFWRRWHISLSTWIRDYVFIPLGGSRGRGRFAVVANLLVAMTLAGLWHGAAWTFVLWGLWHGAGLALHREWHDRVVVRVPALARPGPVLGALSVATTFAFVAAGWVLFAATSLGNVALVARGLFGG